MGQRAIGLFEQEDGSYNMHYTQWINIEDHNNQFNEQTPYGETFREKPMEGKTNMKFEEAEAEAMAKGVSLIVIVDQDYNVEIKNPVS